MKRSFQYVVVAVLFHLSAAATVAQERARLNLSYGAISVDQLPAYVAYETGIFRQNGLDVDIIYFSGGATRIAALVSGDAPITQGSGPAAVTSNLRGSDAVIIAGGVVTLDFWLMSRPEIKTAQQLKGGTIGISRFGGVNDSILRFLLPKLGLTLGKDVTVRQIGGLPERLAALEAGQVQASIFNPPVSFIAQKKGFNVLGDVASLGMVYQHTCVATTRKFIQNNQDVVRRYIKSQIEAVHRLKTDRQTGIKVLSKYVRGLSDQEILGKAYDQAIADNKMPRKQYPSLGGVKSILDDLGESDPKARSAKPEDFVEMRFVQELDQSGFIDKLYRR
jgi:NitT/TauT family transport system substrate-binding protein